MLHQATPSLTNAAGAHKKPRNGVAFYQKLPISCLFVSSSCAYSPPPRRYAPRSRLVLFNVALLSPRSGSLRSRRGIANPDTPPTAPERTIVASLLPSLQRLGVATPRGSLGALTISDGEPQHSAASCLLAAQGSSLRRLSLLAIRSGAYSLQIRLRVFSRKLLHPLA